MANESPAEMQYRLRSEAECRRIAEQIKGQLPEGMGFVLITADIGGGPDAKFSNTSYVATINREDSARLLTELVDHWRQEGGAVTEPSVQTMTKVREFVFSVRDVPIERLLHGARCSLRDLETPLRLKDARAAAAQAFKLACEATAIFDRVLPSLMRRSGS